MRIPKVILALGAFAVFAIVPAVPLGPSTGEVHAQDDDPQAVVEAFFEAIDTGDVAGATALISEDSFVFTQLDSQESFGIVGAPAMNQILGFVIPDTNSATVTDISADDATVTGTVEFSDVDSDDAGVDRYVQDFTATVSETGLITRLDLVYDETDDQTAEYIAYVEAQPDDPPPADAQTFQLAAQPGGNQPGEAIIAELDGLTFVQLLVTPGAADVLQPAHFHTGTCAAPGPIVQPLANVLNGESFTILSAPLSELIDTGLIINVHLSVAQPSIYVSCGLVGTAAPPPAPSPTTPAGPVPTPTAGSGVTAPDTGSGPGDSGTPWLPIVAVIGGAIALAGAAVAVRRA
jgi:ketosteroid isomerase-like protein